jgi:1-phosphatidylinositol-4-phosphate 5-kinase
MLRGKILKDVNFLEINKTKKLVCLKDIEMGHLHAIIKQDSEFLKSHNLMDYSLLLIIEQVKKGSVKAGELSRNQFLAKGGDFIYHVGIIDYLQVWSFEKRMEAAFKTNVMKRNGELISATEPKAYASRFQNFM